MRVTVLIGPSGAGKSTVVRAAAARRPLHVVRTVTTRPRRPGEDDGTHEFVTDAEFDRRLIDGRFVGTHRQYGFRYGLPHLPNDTDRVTPVVTCLRAAVIDALRRRHPRIQVVALEAPVDQLAARLRQRAGAGSVEAGRDDPGELAAEIAAGRRVADLVLDATRPVDRLVDELLARLP